MAVAGYLADIPPHIYRHVDEGSHDLLHELSKPITVADIGRRLGVPEGTVHYRIKGIKAALGISGKEWRVAIVRLYLGVDRCWCMD